MYMNAMIRTLKAQNVFTDTGRLTDLAEAATKSLHVSEEIGTVKRLYDLGTQLRTVPTDRITMTTLPTAQDPQDANHLVPAGADADRVWSMIRDDVPFDGKERPERPERSDWRTGTARSQQSALNSGDLPGATDARDGSDAGPCMDVYAPYRW